MISPLKFDKRLTTHLIQRGELKSEELNAHLSTLSDLVNKAQSARREPEVEAQAEVTEGDAKETEGAEP